MPLTTVVVPWRGGCEHRARALEWVQARYRAHHPGWRVVVAPVPRGPWVKAAAVWAATPRSGVVIVADGDVWCDALAVAVEAVRGGAPWALPHRTVRRLAPEPTRRVLAGAPPSRRMECTQLPYRGTRGGGLVVLRAEVLRAVPPDPRFEGWGGEDAAWGHALTALAGRPASGHAELWHLWHPPQARLSRRIGSHANQALLERYRAARSDRAAMLALIAEAHDRLHGQEGALRRPPGPRLEGAPR